MGAYFYEMDSSDFNFDFRYPTDVNGVDSPHFNEVTGHSKEHSGITNDVQTQFEPAIFANLDWDPLSNLDNLDDIFPTQTPMEAQTQRPMNIDGDVNRNSCLGAVVPDTTTEHELETLPLADASPLVPANSTIGAAKILRAWLDENPKNLYPSHTTKASLSHATGLDIKQVSTWFNNYRSRNKSPRPVKSLSTHLNGMEQHLDEVKQVLEVLAIADVEKIRHNTHNCDSSNSSNSDASHHAAAPNSPPRPLSASRLDFNNSMYARNSETSIIAAYLKGGSDLLSTWHLTLPGDGCYNHTDDYLEDQSMTRLPRKFGNETMAADAEPNGQWTIGPHRSAADMMIEHKTRSLDRSPESSTMMKRSASQEEYTGSRNLRRRTSAESVDSRTGLPAECDGASATSGRTTSSGESHRSSTSRRGRRVHGATFVSSGPFGCSKCASRFSRKADRKKHEITIHDPVRQYLCRPIDYSVPLGSESNTFKLPLCLCGSNPHACDHKMLQCWGQAEEQRTFYRLDQFRRHLEFTHGLKTHMPHIDATRLRVDSLTASPLLWGRSDTVWV